MKNPVSIHFDSTKRQNCGKGDEKLSEDYIQTICISSDHDKKFCKVSKESA